MMLDHATFACLQFPSEWGHPRFQLGQTVSCDDGTGFIIGATYSDEHSMNPGDDQECVGWWFWICFETVVAGRVLKNVLGKHQDVIQPVNQSVDLVAWQQHGSSTPISILEPLLYSAF